MAGQRPETPAIVVTKNTAFSPSAMEILPNDAHRLLKQVDQGWQVGAPSVKDCSVRRRKRHVGTTDHRHPDVGECRRIIDAVADLHDDLTVILVSLDSTLLVLWHQLYIWSMPRSRAPVSITAQIPASAKRRSAATASLLNSSRMACSRRSRRNRRAPLPSCPSDELSLVFGERGDPFSAAGQFPENCPDAFSRHLYEFLDRLRASASEAA